MKQFEYLEGMTHGGVFHADEVGTTAAIRLLFKPDFPVERVFQVPDDVSETTFVYDIGGGSYDHHQRGGNGCRANGVPFSSFGLFWRDFCPFSDFIKEKVDQNLIQGIDAIDNGVEIPGGNFGIKNISELIRDFNPTWDSDIDASASFGEAVNFMMTVLEHEIKSAQSKEKAGEIVRKAYESRDGHIVILPHFVPWQEFILELDERKEVLYVIFPSLRGGYSVQAVPVEYKSFETRKPLPEAWAGVSKENLQKVSVPDAIFCHNGRFICAAESLSGAVEMAKMAVDVKK